MSDEEVTRYNPVYVVRYDDGSVEVLFDGSVAYMPQGDFDALGSTDDERARALLGMPRPAPSDFAGIAKALREGRN